MRNVALDLGVRQISFCEIAQGVVVRRATVRTVGALKEWLGPQTPAATVAFEACREGWSLFDRLQEWGHRPIMVDTTRVRQLGIGQHRRKTDRIDAETLARALERGSIPLAHVLSPHRRQLRLQLQVRRALVETRAQYVASIRGIVRACGDKLPPSKCDQFAKRLGESPLKEHTRELVAPLSSLLNQLDEQIGAVERKLALLCEQEPAVGVLTTVPGINLIVAVAMVSVIDEAHRFRRAHEVESYLGLVPGEDSSGGRRRVGSITKHGNTYLRALLVQASWIILRGKSEDPLTHWGRAVVERRGKRIGVVAIARRLAGILWAMWRDGTVYDPAHLGQAGASGLQRQAQSIEFRAAALTKAARKVATRYPATTRD